MLLKYVLITKFRITFAQTNEKLFAAKLTPPGHHVTYHILRTETQTIALANAYAA